MRARSLTFRSYTLSLFKRCALSGIEGHEARMADSIGPQDGTTEAAWKEFLREFLRALCNSDYAKLRLHIHRKGAKNAKRNGSRSLEPDFSLHSLVSLCLGKFGFAALTAGTHRHRVSLRVFGCGPAAPYYKGVNPCSHGKYLRAAKPFTSTSTCTLAWTWTWTWAAFFFWFRLCCSMFIGRICEYPCSIVDAR